MHVTDPANGDGAYSQFSMREDECIATHEQKYWPEDIKWNTLPNSVSWAKLE